MTILQTITITAALLWKPVAMGPRNPGCPSRDGLSVSVLNFPPFTMTSPSGELEGLLGEFFTQIAKRCFIRHCKLPISDIRTTVFNSTEEFESTIRENKIDIAFPISRPTKMSLSKHDHENTISSLELVRFQLFLTSPAYLLIMDVENVNRKVSKQELNALFENSWPVVTFTLLIAGISGMVMWILVRWTVYCNS